MSLSSTAQRARAIIQSLRDSNQKRLPHGSLA